LFHGVGWIKIQRRLSNSSFFFSLFLPFCSDVIVLNDIIEQAARRPSARRNTIIMEEEEEGVRYTIMHR
jgi:hypothetical protein